MEEQTAMEHVEAATTARKSERIKLKSDFKFCNQRIRVILDQYRRKEPSSHAEWKPARHKKTF